MILAKEQRIGAAILIGIALVGWIVVAVWPSRQPVPAPEPAPQKKHRTWEERRDSMDRADSIRYARYAAEREQRYDSFRVADSMRRAELKARLKYFRDSARVADSLWRDSMGIYFTRHIKKDTIIDLNHCDTTDLLYLRGIGQYTAIQILRYREQLGGFYSPSQLTDAPLSTPAPSTGFSGIPICDTIKRRQSTRFAVKRYVSVPSKTFGLFRN